MPATWKDLKDDYGPDDGVASIPFEDLNKIARVLNSIYSDAGEIERTPSGRGWRIPILNAGLAKYMAENFADKTSVPFPAIVTNSGSDGVFTEAVYDEAAPGWIAQPTDPITGTVTEYHHSVARVQDNTQGWLVGFTGDDGTLLYFSIGGFVKGEGATHDVLQYADDPTDGLGPEWVTWIDSFFAKFRADGITWDEVMTPTSWTTGGVSPAKSGVIGTNTTEANANTHMPDGLVVLMQDTREASSNQYTFFSPVPYMGQYQVVTALEGGKPVATNVRASS